MKTKSSLFIGIIAILSVAVQFYLMIENRVESVPETVIRFFSFFTILTNLLVGIYFVFYFINSLNNKKYFLAKPGNLTALTVYITIVGLVYQLVLRSTWKPEGLQKVVDELLHTIIPVLVILFWIYYENKKELKYKSIFQWLVYPIFYLFFILIRGSFSNFYPYPFVNVVTLGYSKVIVNSALLVLIFTIISALFIKIGRQFSKR